MSALKTLDITLLGQVSKSVLTSNPQVMHTFIEILTCQWWL